MDVDAAMDERRGEDKTKMNNGPKPPSHELPEATAQGPVADGTVYDCDG
jgi:hypothetical protein